MKNKEDFRFRAENRIKSKKDFKAVFSKGKVFFTNFFVVRRAGNNLFLPRLGVVVSKRKTRTNVRRNKIRRVVKNSFRIRIARLEAEDFVFILRKNVICTNSRQVFLDVKKFWESFCSEEIDIKNSRER